MQPVPNAQVTFYLIGVYGTMYNLTTIDYGHIV